jgi:hypothetical protein
MEAVIPFLIEFAETNFFLGLIDHLAGKFPQKVVEILPEKRDPNCPIRFTLEFDLASLLKPS